MKSMLIFIVVMGTLTMPLVSCSPKRAPTAETITASSLPIITSTANTTKPSQTISPTSTPTPTPTTPPIPTNLPTYSPEIAQKIVLDLIVPDEKCKLPCWWNVIPGETKWDSVYPSIKQLAFKIQESKNDQKETYSIFTYVPTSINRKGVLAQGFEVENGVVTSIFANPGNKEFTLKNLAGFFPTTIPQIYIRTFSESREVLPFYMIMYYPDQGVLVSYYSDAVIQGDQVKGCFNIFSNDINNPSQLIIKSPNMSFKEFTKDPAILGVGESKYYLRLEEVSKITPQEIHTQIEEGGREICIETSTSQWPSP